MEVRYEGRRYGGGTRKKRVPPLPVPPPRVPTPRPSSDARLSVPQEVAESGHRVEMEVLSAGTSFSNLTKEAVKATLYADSMLPKIEECADSEWLYSRFETRLTLSAGGNSSAAAAFFARATQKLNLSSGSGGGSPHRRKRGGHAAAAPEDEPPPAGFCLALLRHPPPLPSALLRRLGTKELSALGKVRVMLKVCEGLSESSVLSVDSKRRQVTLYEPSPAASCSPPTSGAPGSSTPQDRRLAIAAPKMFAFDAVFSHEDPQSCTVITRSRSGRRWRPSAETCSTRTRRRRRRKTAEVCGTALTDLIHAVITGTDGCLFCYGHPKLGKTQTMLGTWENACTLGVMPCAISWLFRCIGEQKQKSGTRFSVRVSALEVTTTSYPIKDLLAHHATDKDQSPSIYLCEGGLQNWCELRAPNAERAAFYLDAALATRSQQHSHLFYTLHVYQYSVAGKGAVAGGRSRLHLIDLGNCERSKAAGGLPLSAIGNVLLAIFNGQKHLPHKEHRLTQQLKECLGSLTCHAAMIAHVSPHTANYTDTLATVQLASRIHRMRRRKFKYMGAGSGGGAAACLDEGGGSGRLTGSSDVDPSSSEQSADTVIYLGPTEETDGEHPPVYIPSLNSGDNRCAMGRALKGSVLDQKLRATSKSVPASPQKCQEDRALATGINLSHRNNGKPPKPNSTKSSPGKGPPGGSVRPPEEQWVDGPRIPKSRLTEARHIHMSGSADKHETWVDGPRLANGHSSSAPTGYGFMDYHKKSMIRKWVENQSIHAISKAKHGGFKEMTVFKTMEEARGRASGQEDEGTPAPSQLLQPQHTNQGIPERLPCSGIEADEDFDEEDEDMEVEIIEVEEPMETVPMQDCCLQVTEEDIALCMGELENPLPEVDQEEHPLRILSQENLTVVSTFTDSLSIANDLERIFPRNPGLMNQVNGWPYHKEATNEIIANKISQYEQLSKLHELYNSKVTRSEMRPVSRCQSLMFSELITELPSDFDANSIASEPAYLPGERSKLCDNCKINLENKSDDAEALLFKNDTRYQSYQQMTRSISSLRHPDGASNPNLGELGGSGRGRREPGEGARAVVTNLEDEDDISVPPPLLNDLLTLNRDGYDTMKNKSQDNLDITNGLVHDPGGKGKLSHQKSYSNNGEKLERGWCIKSNLRLLKATRPSQQTSMQKTENNGTTKHRLLFPFGHGLLGRRNNFQTSVSSRSANPPQAS